jgi:hypothetical protein
MATVVRKALIPFVVIGATMVILLTSRAPAFLTQSHAPVKELAKSANLQAYVRYIYGMHVHLNFGKTCLFVCQTVVLGYGDSAS